jgi:hypothetical protein
MGGDLWSDGDGNSLDTELNGEQSSGTKTGARVKTGTTTTEQPYDLEESLKKMGIDISFMDKQAEFNWLSILLSMSTTSDALKDEIYEFITNLDHQVFDEAINDIDGFLSRTGGGWDTHDPAIDTLWDDLLTRVKGLMGETFPVAQMVKPSGPLKAICHIQWHYPTFATRNPDYGHVMDHTNPSLRIQYLKMGLPRTVRTVDTIPMRHATSKREVS